MTKRADHRVHRLPSAVALCLTLLQLVSSLHFALVPHGFGSDLNGLVHLRRTLTTDQLDERAQSATQPAPGRPSLVAERASCEPEACPLGFSGPLARLAPASDHSLLTWLSSSQSPVAHTGGIISRSRALLDAPKTSPPLAV